MNINHLPDVNSVTPATSLRRIVLSKPHSVGQRSYLTHTFWIGLTLISFLKIKNMFGRNFEIYQCLDSGLEQIYNNYECFFGRDFKLFVIKICKEICGIGALWKLIISVLQEGAFVKIEQFEWLMRCPEDFQQPHINERVDYTVQ